MTLIQKFVLLLGVALLVRCLAYPLTQYPSGYDRLVVNGMVVRNDISFSKDHKYFREAEKPDHKVEYSNVFERAIGIIIVAGVLFLVAGALGSRQRREPNN